MGEWTDKDSRYVWISLAKIFLALLVFHMCVFWAGHFFACHDIEIKAVSQKELTSEH